MNSEKYRKVQEERFSNNTGTTLTEIIFVTQLPLALHCFSLLVFGSFFCGTHNIYTIVLVQFCCTFVPHILLLTISSSYVYHVYVFLVLTGFIILGYKRTWFDTRHDFTKALTDVTIDTKLPTVTIFRAITNSFSVICILAADFTCFPGRYLKTEQQGYGLMDTGIGLYVMSSALTNSQFTKSDKLVRSSSFISLVLAVKKVLPLLVIGMGRYVGTSLVSYHHRLSEYGTHWNFFITLAVLALLNEILAFFICTIETVFVLVAILIPLQEVLLYSGMRDWINSDSSRSTFLSSNKEGICSLLGCEILYMCGLIIRHYLPKKEEKYDQYVKRIVYLFVSFIILICCTVFSEQVFQVSRKTTNCGYILWILSVSLISLISSMILEVLTYVTSYANGKRKKVPLILEVINFNGLAFFLIGNLLTGLVNLCMRTLMANRATAVIIIVFYMLTCCMSTVYLYSKNIRLKV